MLGLYLWCAKRHGRELLWLLMLAGSLVFYGWNSVHYLPVLLGKNSEISARNRKRNVRGRTDGKMPERAGRNVRI